MNFAYHGVACQYIFGEEFALYWCGMEPLGEIVVSGALFACIFIVAEVAYRNGIPGYVTRKIVHIGAGLITASLPFFLPPSLIIAFGVVFSIFIVWTKRTHRLPSVHDADRDGVGAVVFAPGATLLALLTMYHNPLIFQGAVLIMALSDAVAGLVGRSVGRYRPLLLRGKSLEGVIACFLVTLLILVPFLVHAGHIHLCAVAVYGVVGALTVALAEAFVRGGWDNLSVLFAGAVVLFVVL